MVVQTRNGRLSFCVLEMAMQARLALHEGHNEVAAAIKLAAARLAEMVPPGCEEMGVAECLDAVPNCLDLSQEWDIDDHKETVVKAKAVSIEPIRSYTFTPYDVLQVDRKNTWLDFITLRTVKDGIEAMNLVDIGHFEGETLEFRIVSQNKSMVKYVSKAKTRKHPRKEGV